MKIKNENFKKYVFLTIFLIIGIVFMILPEGIENEEKASDYDTTVVLEKRIEDLIRNTYNTDDVTVILTYDTNGEKIVNYSESENDVYFGNDNEPFVKSEKLPYVRGALIAVKNIDHEKCESIKDAISVLLGISSHKVTVIYN